MTFDTVIGILLSVLLPKVFENIANKNHTRLSAIIKLVLIAVIFSISVNFDKTIKILLNQDFIVLYDKITSSPYFVIIMMTALFIAIIYVYSNDSKGKCSFEKMSKAIADFTSQVSDNDIIYIFCGDMDVWGSDPNHSTEFQQLLKLQQENRNLEIRILCKHCMDDDLIEEILEDRYDLDGIQCESRLKAVQVERVAYFKNHLKKCSFRFYKDPKDDYSNLRGRVIISHGIKKVLIYHKALSQNTPFFKLFSKHRKREYVYEFNELTSRDNYQLLHYVELCDLKWRGCDPALATKIEEYCIKYSQLKQGKKRTLKKIAFIYAKTYEVAHFGKARKEFPPFGVMYLAAMVREYCQDWIPEIIAIEDSDVDINPKLYDVIAYSVISAYTVPVFEKCMNKVNQQSKTYANKVLCIAGGYQAELEAERWLKSNMVSLVLKGEGENTIVKLLNAEYSSKEKKEGYLLKKTYAKIAGAMFMENRTKGKIFRKIPLEGECVDLNKIPMPARDLLPEEDYIMNDRLADTNCKMVHVIFSRGCSYNCVYCGVPREGNRTVRYRSPQNIIDELEYLKNMGIEGFSIIDDCFLTNERQALNIIKEISKVELRWSLTARVDQINEKIVEALKGSGCLEIKFGIETGSNKILKEMKKGFTAEEAKAAIELVRSYDIGVKAFIITGLPGEDDNTNRETEDFLKEMGKEKINRISLLRFVPLPGSHIFENPKNYGINKNIKETIDYSCYKLYDGETNWWEKEEDFIKRNEIYEHIKTFMLGIWDTI